MSRLRLFYVLDSLEENDVGDQVATLLERMPRSSFEPRVVGLGPEGALGSRIRQMSVTVHRLGLTGTAGSFLAVPRLRSLLRNLGADIVHTYQPWSGAAAQVAAPREARVFRSVRGFVSGPRTVEQRIHAWVERRAARLRRRQFTVADELALDVVRRRFKARDVEVVPECLDVQAIREAQSHVGDHEARVSLGMDDGQRAVIIASDFQDRAVPMTILEGFATARVESPGLRLFFLGTGPEEGAVRWNAEELRLEDSVVFLGASAQHHAAILRVSEACVDAGSWPGWARIALEAMALRLPVLRWVEEGDEAGQARYPVRTAGSAARFARDLLDVLDDESTRERVAALGEAEAQRYDVATVAEVWTQLYTR